MPATNINIEDVILQQTDSAIGEADFSSLRKYLLEKKPLAVVTKRIDGIISNHFIEKERALGKSATQAALAGQIQQDTDEQSLDAKEKMRDKALKEEYSRSLPLKESLRLSLATQYVLKDTFYKQICSQIADLESALRQNTSQIQKIVTERQALLTRMQAIPAHTNPNVHTHTPTHEHSTHTHLVDGGQNVHTHAPTHEHSTHTHPAIPSPDQMTLDRLNREEIALKDQKQFIKEQISRKISETTIEQSVLQSILTEKSQVDEEIQRLQNVLNSDLPAKERGRDSRQEQRTARQNARTNTGSDIQLLLSPENYNALQSQLASNARQCTAQSKQLTDTVLLRSYPVYMTQLELKLQQGKGLQIAPNERQSLSQILRLMKNFQDMVNSEQLRISTLAEKRRNLRRLETELTENQLELERCIVSNRDLLAANIKLDEDSVQLSSKLATAEGRNTASIVVSLVSGVSGGIVTAIFFDSLMLTPLFFAIPAALGLVAIIGTIIAIAKYVEANGYREQITHNTQTKTQNLETIRRQEQQIIEIPQSIIPKLESQIKAAKKEISQLEGELQDLQKQMSQLNNLAERVGISASDHSFFGGNSAVTGSIPNVPPPAYEAPGTAPTFFASAAPPSAPPSETSGYNAPVFPRMPDDLQPSAPPANGPQA